MLGSSLDRWWRNFQLRYFTTGPITFSVFETLRILGLVVLFFFLLYAKI